MAEVDEITREFLVESFENLEQLDRELLTLEANPSGLDTINRIFRIVHTVKGTCGFFNFHKLERVSHVGENLLDSLRSSKVLVTRPIVDGLLGLCDCLKEILLTISETGTEGERDDSALISLLERLNSESAFESAAHAIMGDSAITEAPPTQDTDLEKMFAAAKQEYRVQQTSVPPTPVAQVDAPPRPSKPPVEHEAKRSDVADTTLRVDVHLLDKLMNLVGELVLARNQILQFTKSNDSDDFVSTSQRLNLITSELQDGVMRTRMQPIATVWNKLPRIVRDVAQSCGKTVELEMHGKETELDKTIIEAIKDPLTHIIRNAVDHGVESPETRIASGKPSGGTLTMRAFHEGGQVIIQIVDDGAGLNSERIRAKAIEKGIITPEKSESMSDADVRRLIFLPGFSTAEKVTNISGRGVGMDVVRSNIERIGGSIDVQSVQGKGTTFTIKIPLTLAIIPALIVSTQGYRYAIPQVNLLELVRVENSVAGKGIERVQGSDFYRLRGKLLPLVYLAEQLGLRDTSNRSAKSEGVLTIVVVRGDHHQFGIVVDSIRDTEEIVVKPLGRMLKAIPAFAGATIMGDGQVALILDVVGIGRGAHITRKEAISAQEDAIQAVVPQGTQVRLLVFHIGGKQRAAIPLHEVYRLEEFTSDQIEQSGDHLVVQYRGGILPLVDLRGKIQSESATGDSGPLKAFVYAEGMRLIGFVVNQIVDIVEQSLSIENPFAKIGFLGSAVVQDKVTDIVDLPEIIRKSGLRSEDQAVTQHLQEMYE